MSRETFAEIIWWGTDVPVFLEKFILPVLATAVTALVILNPMKFDTSSRIALAVGLIAFAYLASHQIHLRNEMLRAGSNQTAPQTKPPISSPPAPAPTTTNRTSGPESPINTGNGNSVVYQASPPQHKKNNASPKKGDSP